jgi:hypothetical protein
MRPSSQPRSLPSVQPSQQPSTQTHDHPFTVPLIQPSCRPSATQPVSSLAYDRTQPTTKRTTQPTMHPSSLPITEPSSRPFSQVDNPVVDHRFHFLVVPLLEHPQFLRVGVCRFVTRSYSSGTPSAFSFRGRQLPPPRRRSCRLRSQRRSPLVSPCQSQVGSPVAHNPAAHNPAHFIRPNRPHHHQCSRPRVGRTPQ